MSAVAAPAAPPDVAAPPYLAALRISGTGWKSRLLHDGQVQLSQPEVHIGILSNNDVVLADARASRLHAAIRWTPTGYAIQDLESQNGTFVEGQRITQPVLLVPGQRIRIGNTDMVFEQAGPAPAAAQSRLQHWIALQLHKQYWRIFIVGFAGYLIGAVALNASDNNHLVPLVALLGAATVPVAFAIFCWEEGAFVDVPPTVVGLAFLSGALFGLLGASVFEAPLLNADSSPAATGIVAGVVEESVKAALLVWFLRDKRLRSELDGLVLGVAVGMGFAAFETAGYGVDAFANNLSTSFGVAIVDSFKHLGGITVDAANADLVAAMKSGYENLEIALNTRMLFALFGHGMWTGMVGAAIWRERGQRTFRLTGGVALTFALAVVLHALFDGFALSSAAGLALLIAPITVLFFAFFLSEAVRRAKLGALAPPPPPLPTAMMQFFSRPFTRRVSQLHPAVTAAMATATPVQAGAAPTAASPRFCPHCGSPATPGNNFCASCGGSLN